MAFSVIMMFTEGKVGIGKIQTSGSVLAGVWNVIFHCGISVFWRVVWVFPAAFSVCKTFMHREFLTFIALTLVLVGLWIMNISH